jgi:hypothetical protein
MLFVVRVWADTADGIAAKSLAMRTALQGIDGAEFMQVNNAAQARHLFYETVPGNLGGTYRGWDIYVENHNLADLMPLSSTFTGHLDDAQALYDSPGRSVVGIRLVTPNGTPQHSIVVGVNGSGKSALLMDLMSQTDCDWAYRFYQEEGMAFVTQAQLCGMRSLVLRESGDCTLNPFDTLGLPLTSATIARVVRTCMKLVGLSRDEDRNRRREGLIGEYVRSHFEDCAEDWKNAGARTAGGPGPPRARRREDALRRRRLPRRAPRPRETRAGGPRASAELLAAAERGRGPAPLHDSPGQAQEHRRHGVQPPRAGGLPEVRRARRAHEARPPRPPPERRRWPPSSTSSPPSSRRGCAPAGSWAASSTARPMSTSAAPACTSTPAAFPEGTLKELAGFVVFDHVRQHILTLPAGRPRR